MSKKRGFETDHSSTHTDYIMGFTVTCDYDWWTCEFELPYNKSLFKKIKKYEASGDYELVIKKKQDEILIAILVHLDYGAIEPNNPYIAFANMCAKIRKNIIDGDFSDLELLKAYVEDEAKFHELDSTSGIKYIIESNC
ncbi:MAG: hypothetical protein ACTSRG_07420 [Candidatus Helarchaeota archaeon]